MSRLMDAVADTVSERGRRARWAPKALGVIAYFAFYILLDWASLLPPQPGAALGITPWNPPAGLSMALLLRYGWRFAPAVFCAVAVGDVLFRGLPAASPVTFASAALVAVGYGAAAAILRPRISLRLDSHSDLLRLLGVSLIATMAVALSVVAVFATGGLLRWSDVAESALHFWVGDMIGVAVLTPFLLLMAERGALSPRLRSPSLLEAVVQALAIWAGLWVIFGWEPTDHFEYSYVLFLPLIWIALRGALLGAAWGILATQLGLIVAIQLKGFDAGVTTQFQLLMMAVAVTGLMLGSVVKERRLAGASLREREARLQTIVRTAPDAILTFDEWGVVTSANPAAAQMFAVEGGPVGTAVHTLLGIGTGDRAAVAGREVVAQRRDGTMFPAEIAIGETPLDGRLLSVAVVRDVTARKQAELWLKEHEAELAHAMRLTATGEMAAALAHELNQPLTALIGFARACQEVMRAGEAGREAASELIDQAVQQALRAGEIIRSTREFLRRGDTRLGKVAVADIFKAVLDLVHAEAALNRVGIVTRFDGALPPVLADRIQIEQVILNLIRNSIEAMRGRPGPEITLSARISPDPALVEISVRDNGPGVPAEVADRLFRPFATTKDTGMGLGLSISRSIVEAHGGRIWLAPLPAGQGSDMRFTLPMHTDAKSDA